MAVTSYKFPATVTDDSTVGTVVWDGPGNVSADDGTNAGFHATSGGLRISHYLNCTNFGFTSADIPSGATINGIEMEYQRSEGGITDNVKTSRIVAIKGGTIQSTDIK